MAEAYKNAYLDITSSAQDFYTCPASTTPGRRRIAGICVRRGCRPRARERNADPGHRSGRPTPRARAVP